METNIKIEGLGFVPMEKGTKSNQGEAAISFSKQPFTRDHPFPLQYYSSDNQDEYISLEIPEFNKEETKGNSLSSSAGHHSESHTLNYSINQTSMGVNYEEGNSDLQEVHTQRNLVLNNQQYLNTQFSRAKDPRNIFPVTADTETSSNQQFHELQNSAHTQQFAQESIANDIDFKIPDYLHQQYFQNFRYPNIGQDPEYRDQHLTHTSHGLTVPLQSNLLQHQVQYQLPTNYGEENLQIKEHNIQINHLSEVHNHSSQSNVILGNHYYLDSQLQHDLVQPPKIYNHSGLSDTNLRNNFQTSQVPQSFQRNFTSEVFLQSSSSGFGGDGNMEKQELKRSQSFVGSNAKRQSTLGSREMQMKTTPSSPYIPAEPDVDISVFTEEDVGILKSLLPLSEVHKWKYISRKLSLTRKKKLDSQTCCSKFHKLNGLPYNYSKDLTENLPFIKVNNQNSEPSNKPSSSRNISYEGCLGSSIPYVVSKDGWKLLE